MSDTVGLTASVRNSQLLILFMAGVARDSRVLPDRTVRKANRKPALEEHLLNLLSRTATRSVLGIYQAQGSQMPVGSGAKNSADASGVPPEWLLVRPSEPSFRNFQFDLGGLPRSAQGPPNPAISGLRVGLVSRSFNATREDA